MKSRSENIRSDSAARSRDLSYLSAFVSRFDGSTAAEARQLNESRRIESLCDRFNDFDERDIYNRRIRELSVRWKQICWSDNLINSFVRIDCFIDSFNIIRL